MSCKYNERYNSLHSLQDNYHTHLFYSIINQFTHITKGSTCEINIMYGIITKIGWLLNGHYFFYLLTIS